MATMNAGRRDGDDYISLPYNPKWQPILERRWALDYCTPPGEEDNQTGYERECQRRFPQMWKSGVASFCQDVDDYVRNDSQGRRQDIDWELAGIPPTQEEIDAQKERKQGLLRQRRTDLLKLRKDEEAAEKPQRKPRKPKQTGRDAIGEEMVQ